MAHRLADWTESWEWTSRQPGILGAAETMAVQSRWVLSVAGQAASSSVTSQWFLIPKAVYPSAERTSTVARLCRLAIWCCPISRCWWRLSLMAGGLFGSSRFRGEKG